MEIADEHYRIAKIAYDAYVKQAGGVSLATGDKLPEFAELKYSIANAWAAVGIAVALDCEMQKQHMETERQYRVVAVDKLEGYDDMPGFKWFADAEAVLISQPEGTAKIQYQNIPVEVPEERKRKGPWLDLASSTGDGK
jgi:hypothetical protein